MGLRQHAPGRPAPARRHRPHSPPKYRVHGLVANFKEFGKAFSCKPGQPMAPVNRAASGDVRAAGRGRAAAVVVGRPGHPADHCAVGKDFDMTETRTPPSGRQASPAARASARCCCVARRWSSTGLRQKERIEATDSWAARSTCSCRAAPARGGDVLRPRTARWCAEGGAAAGAGGHALHGHGTPFDLLRRVPPGQPPRAAGAAADRLLLEPDHVLADMLRAAPDRHRWPAFEPEGGAYGASGARTQVTRMGTSTRTRA